MLAAGSPPWLADLRRRALERARAIPGPSRDDERWRFTDLSRLDLDSLGEREAPEPRRRPGGLELLDARERSTLVPSIEELSGLLVLEESVPVLLLLSEEAARAGVVLGDLASAARERRELVEGRLGALCGSDDRYGAHGLALHGGGAFLYLPPGVELARPIQTVHLSRRATSFSRSLVVLGQGAQARWNEIYRSGREDLPSLGIPATEVFLEAGASLEWTLWQQAKGRARQLARIGARLGESSRLAMLSVAGGGELMRTELDLSLAGRCAQAELLGLYAPRGTERVEHLTRQLHLAPATRSDLHYRGVLAGEARSLYHGTIEVARAARKTDAYQANRNLLLSPRASAQSLPRLEIEENDVRCTHGATVGPIDPAQLFYLMSRGLPRPNAEQLIANGFLATVLERAPWSGLAPRIAETLAMPAAGA
jgi:Fe-S cluster assembly protein SufD